MKQEEAQYVVDELRKELAESVSQRELSPLLAGGVLNTLSNIMQSMVDPELAPGEVGNVQSD